MLKILPYELILIPYNYELTMNSEAKGGKNLTMKLS
jgi:hypothetical protein